MANDALPHDPPQIPDNLMVYPLNVRVDLGMGEPTDEDMRLIRRLAGPDISPKDVFRFPSIASTDALDSYYTRMDVRTSLANFRRDLQAGAALLDSHFVFRLPIGMSYNATVDDVPGGKAEGVEASKAVSGAFYIPRGIGVSNGQNTDDYIRGIETGIYRKMSIGFGGPEMEILCDVDGSNLYDWDSEYYPGMRLPDGGFVTYTVFRAQLYESSLVYKNATPGALVQRLQALITERRIKGDDARRLGGVFGVRFEMPNFRLAFNERGETMATNPARQLIEGVLIRAGASISSANRDKLRTAVSSLTDAGGSLDSAIETLSAMIGSDEEKDKESEKDRAALATVRAALGVADADDLAAKAREMRRDADAGKEYRRGIIEQIVKDRTAIVGSDVMTDEAQQAIRARLADYSIAELGVEAKAWQVRKSEAFVPGRPSGATDVNRAPLSEAESLFEDVKHN